jgi:glutathione peroxidase-family protein
MIVNTASLCGYTPQYAGLQELWTEFHGRGLMIIGAPSNDFGSQEQAVQVRSRRPRNTTEWCGDRSHHFGIRAIPRSEG